MSNGFKLGQKLRDTVSGLEGIAWARAEYLSGCVRYCLQPKVNAEKPETVPDAIWVDREQLEFVDDGISDLTAEPSGGDRQDPPSRRGL